MNNQTARDVMNPDVLTARADWPVSRLAEFFIEEGISGAPVTNGDGTLIGVVSLTDLVRHDSMPQREPHAHSPHAFYRYPLDEQYAEEEVSTFRIASNSQATVRDIMTPTIFRVREQTPVADIADLMIKGRIHRVFVTRGKLVVGIVTALDLLKVVRGH